MGCDEDGECTASLVVTCAVSWFALPSVVYMYLDLYFRYVGPLSVAARAKTAAAVLAGDAPPDDY